ncbi:MAG TPA: 50S ribosomal protein L23 [Candidatus Paceibacterota bacterium]|jgi:large subunit ribosomal protein L23|nr:50S ribosomal protein L23 [Candidatus Paceibacterota bacterium]
MAEVFIIKKPWVTEKATRLSESGKYVFIVAPHATKPEIKKAVKETYKVDAVSVNMVNRPAKIKRFGQAMKGATGGYRKAIVTLKKGQKIDIQ